MDEKELIAAIRGHKLIGRGSCTIDECYDDKELWQAFGPPAGNTTIEAAIADAIDSEDLRVDAMVNARFGDDDDAELKISKEWEDAKKEHGR